MLGTTGSSVGAMEGEDPFGTDQFTGLLHELLMCSLIIIMSV